jgi:hypothetical protein
VPEVRGGETDVTDYQRALSVIAAYEVGGVGWLKREIGVAEARGRAAAMTAYADTLDRLLVDCRRVVPDLRPIDAGD